MFVAGCNKICNNVSTVVMTANILPNESRTAIFSHTVYGMNEERNATGGWIFSHRKEKGWTMEVLATKAGTTRTSISRYESGKEKPSRKMCASLANALGANEQELVYAVTSDTVSNRQTLTYITDPLQAEAVKLFQGLPPELQAAGIESLKGLKTAADILRERQEAQRIGKRADREENPSQRATQPEIYGDDE
jgi:transcriptional regulator with XRE-family HTH domain